MNQLTLCRWLSRLIRVALGALFLWTGIPKIVTPADFQSSIYNYELLPQQIAMVAAIVLPWVEFLAGVCLLGGVCAPGTLIVCMGMFTVFGAAQATVLYRGLDISCGCGLVPGDEHITYLTFARSIFLLLSSGVAYYCVLYTSDHRARNTGGLT